MNDINVILNENISFGEKINKIVDLGYTRKFAENKIKENIKLHMPNIPNDIDKDIMLDYQLKEYDTPISKHKPFGLGEVDDNLPPIGGLHDI